MRCVNFLLHLLVEVVALHLAVAAASQSRVLSTARGWVGNSVGSGGMDKQLGIAHSAPNNYAAIAMDAGGTLFTNCVWEESAKEIVSIGSDGRLLRRFEEAHGWSRTGGPAVAAGDSLLFAAGVQSYIGEAYQPPAYPPEGAYWYGFFVINKTDLQPVPQQDGVSFQRMLMRTSDTGMISAAAVDPLTQQLWIVHPTDAAMQAWDTRSMQQTAQSTQALNWTSLAFLPATSSSSSSLSSSLATDSRLWGVLDGQVYPVNLTSGRIAAGFESSPIPGIDSAVSVSASYASASTLVITDGGVRVQQVLLVDVQDAHAPQLLQRVGESGGVWGEFNSSQLPRGHRAPLRFEWLTAAAQDTNGSLVVICSSNTVWQGGEMMASVKSFSPQPDSGQWQLQWEMEGNGWVDSGQFDAEADGRLLYMPNCVYEVTLPLRSDGPSGRCIASTTDLVRHPEDPRLHQLDFMFQSARPVYLQGHKFLLLTGMYGSSVAIHRYTDNSSFTAIPSVLLQPSGKYTDTRPGDNWPPHQPDSAYSWRDRNCNGRFDADEFTAHNVSTIASWSVHIDEAGTLWLLHEDGIERVPLLGLDYCGNPMYARLSDSSLHYAVPSEFSAVERLRYRVEQDVMLLSGWDTNSTQAPQPAWGQTGNLLVFYSNWSSTADRAVLRQTSLHSLWNRTAAPLGPSLKTLDWAGDLLFLVEGYSATITVMDAETLTNLTAVLFNPTETDASWQNGWIDVPDGLQAVKLSSGDYLVAMEDDYCSKTSLLWVGMQPQSQTD